MGRPELSQEQIDMFRARALEAAWRLFERSGENSGIEAVTMRAVARELGCSPMTAYRYFANHEALINDLRAQAFDRFAAILQTAGEAESDELARLAAVGRAYVEFGLKQPETYELMFGYPAAVIPGPSMDRLYAASQRAFATIADVCTAAVNAGRLNTDPQIEAHRRWMWVHGIVTLALSRKLIFGVDVEELVEAEFGDP